MVLMKFPLMVKLCKLLKLTKKQYLMRKMKKLERK